MNFHFALPARAGSLAIGTLVLLHERSPAPAARASNAKELSAAGSERANFSTMHDDSAFWWPMANVDNVSPGDQGRPFWRYIHHTCMASLAAGAGCSDNVFPVPPFFPAEEMTLLHLDSL